MADQPFSDDLVDGVADERSVDGDDLRAALADVQRRFERGDGEYEYSSQHNYAWADDDLFYLYGSEHVWQSLREDLGVADALTDAARAVHERAMVASAAERGNEETVRGMLDDGNEPLAVANSGDDPPLFGQDV